MKHPLTILMYVLTLLIGSVTAYLGMAIQGEIAEAGKACSEVLQKANTGVIVLSTIMLTATIVLIYCSITCNNTCEKEEKGEGESESNTLSSNIKVMYYSLVLILSIVLTTLGALMRNHAKDKTHPCPKIEGKANIVMGLGIFGVVCTTGGLLAWVGWGHKDAILAKAKAMRGGGGGGGGASPRYAMRSSMCGKRSEA